MSAYDSFDEQNRFACRVIADHARATAFSIADGILPGNEGRNYVLRKIMRRAIYQGRHALGFEDAFFYKVTNFVVDQMGEAYPELEASREFIEKMVKLEEERFGNTLTVGLQKLHALIDASRDAKTNEVLVPTEGLAKLYDTYGIPIDLMVVILSQGNFKYIHKLAEPIGDVHYWIDDFTDISEDKFRGAIEELLKRLQQRDTAIPTGESKKIKTAYVALSRRKDTKSEFKGYAATRIDDAKVIALTKGDDEVQSLSEGDDGEVVLDQTPFYAESGGQVGDVGRIINPVATATGTDLTAADSGDSGTGVPPVNHAQDASATLVATVEDAYSPAQGLIVHEVKIEKGTLKVGDVVTAEVDVEKRDATRRNHTATHLMHAALREVLGTHVKQAGSVVAPNYLRFDFSHYQPLTTSEIEEVERLVNYHILRNEPVQTDEMAVEEAMRSGAMALFGEKYGEKVRVLSIKGAEGMFSKELCGGTHVRATGDIGVFKITSDESIASGVRRIRAVTGVDAYERFREDEEIISQVTSNLRTSRAELPAMIGKLQDELKKARREADDLRLKIATGAAGSASSNGDEAREVNGVRVLAREASGLDAAGMRQLSDTLLARIKSGVVVVGRSNDGKASLIVRTSDDLTKRIPAGQVIKELAPIIGGKGGGKPDMAEGGGNQPEKLAEALEASYGVIERMLG
jgi:alanyl-tRNA synthetase